MASNLPVPPYCFKITILFLRLAFSVLCVYELLFDHMFKAAADVVFSFNIFLQGVSSALESTF